MSRRVSHTARRIPESLVFTVPFFPFLSLFWLFPLLFPSLPHIGALLLTISSSCSSCFFFFLMCPQLWPLADVFCFFSFLFAFLFAWFSRILVFSFSVSFWFFLFCVIFSGTTTVFVLCVQANCKHSLLNFRFAPLGLFSSLLLFRNFIHFLRLEQPLYLLI